MLRIFLFISFCFLLNISAYSETKRELKEKISELENINVSLKTQIDSLTNESDSLSKHINNLENQIQALLSEVPCLSFSEEVEGEYLTSYMVATSRNEQAAFSVASDKAKVELATRLEYLIGPVLKGDVIRVARIAKMESVRECLKFRDNGDRTVTAYVVYRLPLKVTVDRIIETMRSYTEKERENFRKQAYKKLGIK